MNSSGEILLKHVNRIFIEIENAEMEIKAEEQQISNTIKISITNTRFLTGLISDYINASPKPSFIRVLEPAVKLLQV